MHRDNDADRIVKELKGLKVELHSIHLALENLSAQPATPTLGISVTGIQGRSSTMAITPVSPITLSDVERVQLSLASKLANGSDDPGPFTWESSNPAVAQVVGLLEDGSPDVSNTSPTTSSVWVLTPADDGTATITANSASPNVNGNSIVLTITEGSSGNVNLSAGTPVSDTP